MYNINAQPNDTGNHGNPVSKPFPGSVALADDLLGAYIEAKGFVHLTTVEDGVVTALETNQEALDAYLADHPDEPEEEEKPTVEERLDAVEDAIERGLSL